MSKQSNSILFKFYRRVKSEIVEKFKKDLGDREAMRRQIDKLQDQIMSLEDELESAKTKLENGGGNQGNNGIPGISLINKIKGPTEREAINKQLELERERMRQEFSKGVDFANNDLKGFDDMIKSGD